MRRVVLSSSAALCLAAATLAGCGGATGSAAGSASSSAQAKTPAVSPVQAVQAAYTKTADTGSTQFTFDGKVSTTGMNMTISGSGVEDLATKDADVTMTVPFAGQMEMRVVDGVTYTKIGGSGTSGGINTGGKWIKQDLGGATGGASGSLAASKPFDAQEFLNLLKTTSSSGVSDRGAETVRGVATTHYSAQLDVAKIAAKQGVATGNSDLQSMIAGAGLSSMPIDLYIDDQGRVRRVGMSLTMNAKPDASSSAAGGLGIPLSGAFSMTMDFFNFGVPVHVAAPPASDVTTGSDLLKGLGAPSGTNG